MYCSCCILTLASNKFFEIYQISAALKLKCNQIGSNVTLLATSTLFDDEEDDDAVRPVIQDRNQMYMFRRRRIMLLFGTSLSSSRINVAVYHTNEMQELQHRRSNN